MKYYLHDSSSFEDEKVQLLFIEFGYEGLGLFYTILEKMAKQEGPVKTVVLKKQLRVGKRLEKVWNFLEEIELISTNNGETFNEKLLKFSEKYQIKNKKTAERVAQWRERQKVTKNVTRNERVCNALQSKSKVKEEIYKEENSRVPSLEEFEKYAYEIAHKVNIKLDPKKLKTKYNAWVENGWKNGNDKPIKNWKSALSNTVNYIQAEKQTEATIFSPSNYIV